MLQLKDCIITLWDIEVKEKYATGNVSSSRYDKKNKKYINSYWRANFMLDAKNKVDGLPPKTKVKITSGTIENTLWEKDGKKGNNLVLAIFDIDIDTNKNEDELPV